jgi:hypothetical protein
MTFRVTFRGMASGVSAPRRESAKAPTREQCEGCDWYHRERFKCVHPHNGRPCNPARVEPWAWGMACPVAK